LGVALPVAEDVPLAPLTTLELGGPARFFVEAAREEQVLEAIDFGARRGVPVFLLGGGSNLVVADAGFPGLVIRLTGRGVAFRPSGDEVLCEVAAGEPWDGVVAQAVARGLAGLECLSGIPGSAGATPIQNVGAYGQEVADTVRWVRALDRRTGAVVDLPAADCGFAYRDSAFKRDPQRHAVLGVGFGLRPGGAPTVRYAELARALAGAAGGASPDLAAVRATVLALRRGKSMVIDPADPNRRSVGSFFTNPIVPAATADILARSAVSAGLAASPEAVPRFPAGPAQVKLAAAWLIERAGFVKGLSRGPVGLSSAHALALVHHGGGRTADLLALAREIRAGVQDRFGLWLVPEPVVVGARPDDPLTLAD
jgi:UDP-N-acetylmuramate dehydrogenase